MAMDSICRSSLVDCNKGLTDRVWHQCFAIALPSSFQPLDLDYGGWSILLVAAWRCMSTVTFRSASQTPVQLGATTVSRKKRLFRVAGWQLEASFGGRFLVTFFGFQERLCCAHRSGVVHPFRIRFVHRLEMSHGTSLLWFVCHASNGFFKLTFNIDSCGLSAPCTTTGS